MILMIKLECKKLSNFFSSMLQEFSLLDFFDLIIEIFFQFFEFFNFFSRNKIDLRIVWSKYVDSFL